MKPELLAIIFGAIVGCMALVAAGIKNFSVKKHNKLSTRPCLSIENEDIIDLPLKISLKNNGVGLAHFDRIEILIDNLLISGEYKKVIERIINLLELNGLDVIFFLPQKGDELDINEKFNLFEANPINSIDHEKICSALKRLTFKIKYSSVYNESFEL